MPKFLIPLCLIGLAGCHRKIPNPEYPKAPQVSQCGQGFYGSTGVLLASATWSGSIQNFNAEQGDTLTIFQKDDSMTTWEVVTDTGPVVYRLEGQVLTLTSTTDIEKYWYYQALVDSCN